MSDVFSTATNHSVVAATPSASMLADLVGEGKKFATPEDLAKAKIEADAFINQLKDENKGLRESAQRDANAGDNLAALQRELAELKAKLNKSAEPSPNTTGELTTGQLENLVAGVMTKKEQERTAAQNMRDANDKLVKFAGSLEKALEVLKSRASELGLSVYDLKAMAEKSPTAFLQIMGAASGKPSATPDLSTPQVNSAAMPLTNGQPTQGTAAYYNNLRKEMGNQKFFANIKLQKEIFAAKKSGLYDSH